MSKPVSEVLKTLDPDKITESEMRQLYDFCLSVAKKHIAFLNRIQGQHQSNTFFNQTLDDEAHTYVTRLFTPIKHSGRILLCELWDKSRKASVNKVFQDEEYMTHLVRNIVSRERNSAMRYHQPQEYKMLRSIRKAILSRKEHEIVKIGRRQYVVRKGITPSAENCIDFELLSHTVSAFFHSSTNVAELAKRSLQIFDEKPFCFSCFRIDHLYAVIVQHLAMMFRIECETSSIEPSEELKAIAESAILKPVKEQIHSIIDKSYTNKLKISEEHGLILKKIINNYLADLFTTGKNDSLGAYISQHTPLSMRRSFKKNHKNKLYYLTNILKQKLEELAAEFLGEEQIPEPSDTRQDASLAEKHKKTC
jgi:uncharacterized protein YaaR (DUF327 family)